MTPTMTRFLAAVPALPVSDERRAVAFLEGALGTRRYLAGTASCRVEVGGVDELYEHCRRHGVVHPNAPLTSTPWGTREFGVLDPDNNLISLYERVDAG